MPLHLIKLAVGVHSVKDLKDRIQARLKQVKTSPKRHIHVTRMTPKRVDELLDGGSIYWVIKGEVAARELLVGIEPFRDCDGIGRCRLMMQPKVIAVRPKPMRPFQGWRYLAAKDAPPDLRKGEETLTAMPEELRRELRDLGLL